MGKHAAAESAGDAESDGTAAGHGAAGHGAAGYGMIDRPAVADAAKAADGADPARPSKKKGTKKRGKKKKKKDEKSGKPSRGKKAARGGARGGAHDGRAHDADGSAKHPHHGGHGHGHGQRKSADSTAAGTAAGAPERVEEASTSTPIATPTPTSASTSASAPASAPAPVPASTSTPPSTPRHPASVTAHAHAYPARERRARRRRAVAYVRMPDSADAGIDLDAGVERALSFAAQRGWQVTDARVVVDRVASAGATSASSLPAPASSAPAAPASAPPPGWRRVRALVDAGSADIVVGVDLDHFAHTLTELVELATAGARIVLADGSVDLTASDADAQLRLLSAVDGFQTRRRGQRHRRAIEERAAQGQPEVSGRRAFGFAQDGVTVVAAEADVVRRVYRDFLAGATVYGIAAALAAENAPLGTGRSWNRTRVRATLRSPVYRGAVIHHGHPVASAAVPPIVDEQTWNAAQAILDDPARRVSPGPTRQHLLSGVLACAVDGCPGTAAFTQGRYRCAVSARHPGVRADTAEAAVRRAVARAVIATGGDVLSRTDIDPHAAEAIARLYDRAGAASGADADDILRTVEGLFDRETVVRRRAVVRALVRVRIVRHPRANAVVVEPVAVAA